MGSRQPVEPTASYCQAMMPWAWRATPEARRPGATLRGKRQSLTAWHRQSGNVIWFSVSGQADVEAASRQAIKPSFKNTLKEMAPEPPFSTSGCAAHATGTPCGEPGEGNPLAAMQPSHASSVKKPKPVYLRDTTRSRCTCSRSGTNHAAEPDSAISSALSSSADKL